jgi:hypothetical protein
MPPFNMPSHKGFEFIEPKEDLEQANVDIRLMVAKQIVIDHYAERDIKLTPNDVYIVWFTKTLQHWKALLSTTRSDGRYYELTHNGDKKETYVDMYIKGANYTVNDLLINPEQTALFEYKV